MKKLFLISILLLGLILSLGCSSENNIQNTGSNSKDTIAISNPPEYSNVDRIEVLHFHGKVQCYSCKIAGAYALETLVTYYPNELKSGKIVFKEINYELPENQELVFLYKPPASAICIGTFDKNGKVYPEELSSVWYKLDDKQKFMDYMKSVLDLRLNGKGK